jgi:hypothetical protein
MSGVGKSTVNAALGERGQPAVDTDTLEWRRWETLTDRSRWQIGAALDALEVALPKLVGAAVDVAPGSVPPR